MEEGMHLIDGNGKFNVEGLKDFMTTTGFAQCRLSYAIVAIIGAQSSGKSTLMNHVFGTDFKMLDACEGRGQTTKGIWIAKSNNIEPFTIAMDFEGTDSNARAEDNTAFERQSTLFALAIADIILINMWCKDIGLENAASRPLLKIVFQVMKRLFKPRKRTLLFVIRDHTKTPLGYLERVLREDIDKIWAAVAEPETHGSASLSDFFNVHKISSPSPVEITALSSYEFEEEKFKEQVAYLRQRFITPRVTGDRWEVEPASGFSIRAEKTWKTIKDNKDLDLPALKVMVAVVRCEEIAEEKLKQFTSDNDWLALKEAVQAGPVSGFGATLSSILETYLSHAVWLQSCSVLLVQLDSESLNLYVYFFNSYDKEVIYFDKDVRNAKRHQMESQALEVVRDAYVTMLEHLYFNKLESFKTRLEQHLLNKREGSVASAHICAQSCLVEFDQGCEDAAIRQSEWNASKLREKLCCDMLSEMMAKYEKQLTDVLADEVQSLFEAGETDTWGLVRNLLKSKTDVAVSEFSDAVVSFDLQKSAIDTKLQHLREYARNVVERKAREAAAADRVLMRMKDRFIQVLNCDENSKSRVWTREENIDEIERNAHSASLKILSIMAAIRLDNMTDQINHVLFSSLMDGTGAVPSSQHTGATADPLASYTWEEVSANATLLTPVECKSLWMQFKADTKYITNQGRAAQEGLRHAKRAIKIVVRVVAIVGAAVAAAVGTPTAMRIAASTEVAAVMKAVAPELAAVMKDLVPEVLAALKDAGPEVLAALKDIVVEAVRSLGPQVVTAVIALMMNVFARPQQL
ncbi:unnamed protein product [Dovyalis caffra]|uniref:GB1/RHD3-type G domain-containing protein n=1 Tax=Dovyalis caffra TaxID=77055 RepID=A0AAV1RKG3_9ROSI|nr:unnamed protein product [Dovyalis caffra]